MLQDDHIGGMLPRGEAPTVEPELIQEDALAGYILRKYRDYDNNRQSSGVEDDIEDSLAAFNMEYSEEDASRIVASGEPNIFIGLTSAKARALSSFIKDILLSSEKPYSIEPTSIPELPKDLQEKIESHFKTIEPRDGKDIKAINQSRRDLENSLVEEIKSIAKHSFSKISRDIEDNLQAGSFYPALSDFIEDLSWAPTAIMKGPIVTKKNRLTWSNGKPIVKEEFIFFNRRVNPMDFYPSPDQSIFIEKLRFSLTELNDLIGVPGYNEEILRDAIDNPVQTQNSLNNSADQQVVDQELQSGGDTSEDEIQGIHWFGAIPTKILESYGLPSTSAVQNVEAILIGSKVVKIIINSDPLGRSPYYFASFQNRPGSFWGTSLPKIMSSEQRMCNASVRALALNLGLSASPQAMITIDRLADDGEIDEIYGGKIWQVKSDPQGNSGRPLDFFHIPSNATELLGVFNRFMEMADDTTGIPKYLYGAQPDQNGAGGTSSGLAMMLEQSTKTIKGSIRHIDDGVIVPRVEQEFYHVMLKSEGNYTGDISVVAIGSQSLVNKSAQQLKRNEFLQTTANAADQKIMGRDGRATLLREMAKDLNLPESIVPSRMELKEMDQSDAKGAQAAAEREEKKINVPIDVAKIQGASSNQGTQIVQENKANENQISKLENDQDFEVAQGKLQLEEQGILINAKGSEGKEALRYQSSKEATEQKREATNRSIALSLKTMGTGEHDKSQV
jgi:hypothetical protein